MARGDSIVGFISGPSLNVWFMHSVFDLLKRDEEQRFLADWLLVLGPYIHSNRNQLQAEFMATDREWLLMLDNDLVFKPEDIWPLFELADEHGPGIYSGPYLLENGALVCGLWNDERAFVYHPLLGLPQDPCRIGVVGAGFTLFHRDVFTAIGENAFSPVAEHSGEDLSVCWRAREAGYTPWLVPACNPGHFKTIALYPGGRARNLIGEEVNLVELDENLKELNELATAQAEA
jgi:hypothetical protein